MARRKFSAEPHIPKYRQVFESLSRDILERPVPGGAEDPERGGAGAAVPDLADHGGPGASGIERAGPGGARRRIRNLRARGAGARETSLTFGLLIPDLGTTEIFEPICKGIAASPRATRHALLWGHCDAAGVAPEEQALQLCEQYMERRVSGSVLCADRDGCTRGRGESRRS